MSVAEDLALARRLTRFYTRADFRALPLDRIVHVTLDGPVLVFEDDRAADAAALNEELYSTERGKGMGLCVAYKRTHDPLKRKMLAAEIREVWSSLVGLAAAYTYPDTPQAWFEFADA